MNALQSLLETADFAASILREVEKSKALGPTSLAGQVIEAGSRLIAAAALVRESDPKLIENETKLRVLKAMKLDEAAWTAGSMHAYGALCFITIPVATMNEGLLLIERLSPINLGNTKEYPSSFWPLAAWDKHPEKRRHDVEPLGAVPYIGQIDGLRGHPECFKFVCFVQTSDGDIVKVNIPVKDSEVKRRYRVRTIPGAYFVEDCVAIGWQPYFTRQFRMYATEGQPNPFVFAS